VQRRIKMERKVNTTEDKMMWLINKYKEERPDLYDDAVDLLKQLGLYGLWNGYYPALANTLEKLDRIETRNFDNYMKEWYNEKRCKENAV
jgi:hypothetical protein